MQHFLELYRYDEILELYQKDNFLKEVAEMRDERASAVWEILFLAANETGNSQFFFDYFDFFAEFAEAENLLHVRMNLVGIYEKEGMVEKKEQCKQALLDDIIQAELYV